MSSRCPLEVPKTPTVTDKVMKTPAIIDVHGALFDPIGSCFDFTFSSLLGASTLGETASLTTDNNFQEKKFLHCQDHRKREVEKKIHIFGVLRHAPPSTRASIHYTPRRPSMGVRERMTTTRGVKEGQRSLLMFGSIKPSVF